MFMSGIPNFARSALELRRTLDETSRTVFGHDRDDFQSRPGHSEFVLTVLPIRSQCVSVTVRQSRCRVFN